MAKSFTEIVELWPSADAMAVELGAKVETVRKWRQRDSIPAEWWLLVVRGARRHGHDLSVDALATLAARKQPNGEAA